MKLMEVHAVPTAPEIIVRMRNAVPAGRQHLDRVELRSLRDLTRALVASKPDAQREYGRFLAIGQRSIGLPGAELAAWLHGKRMLVTGGTGCIGSALLTQLAGFGPARLVSVSRGSTQGPRLPQGEYPRAGCRGRGPASSVSRGGSPR